MLWLTAKKPRIPACLLRCYARSAFLDYVAISTWATKDFPGPYTHVQVLSENHIVDVVSTEIPSLAVLSLPKHEK